MLSNLQPQKADKIIQLIQMFKDDPREHKIDLGVGMYRNANGVTPVMKAVKRAEKLLWEAEGTKSYTGMAGDPGYLEAMTRLVLADSVSSDRVAAAHTPGGTGAVRQALELVRLAERNASVWISAPSWPNHRSIVTYLGMPAREYRYFDYETRGVDFHGMMTSLADAEAGDAIVLHGCCHNPTGANLDLAQWEEVSDLLLKKGAVPIIDIAYQGFGEGLDEDAAPVRLLAAKMPEMLVAASCSKNFGIYRERTGILIAVAPNPATKALAQGTLVFLNRQNYSFPPDHGARLVSMILTDSSLKSEWREELRAMRESMRDLRNSLATALRGLTGSDRFGFIGAHRGMFSLIGASVEQVEAMRERHGIYMVSDGRINVAGLNEKSVPVLAQAMAEAEV
ncbi:MAG: aspartate/tyrosine/aromatic aminotransferase [Albidovulum sp.]|nr:aspartate/tyrosine/aromatic aminotransferase [Albidovulum sp.]MDE0304677.1 aspartate/tyrosine/aromatic aminotransferase [Albidovulum sp.]MDE0530422.1 aspartate/tyrosine/aromatic aminotransferase [Albidovulum sp.]